LNLFFNENIEINMEEELPFELEKYHKSRTIYNWKRSGLKENEETILEIYVGYIRASNCELCGNAFISSTDRRMDHSHETGKFRNIVCTKCNSFKSDKKVYNNTGERFISKTPDKNYTQGFSYRTRIHRNGKVIFNKRHKTLQKAIQIRDNFLAENIKLFT